MTLRTKGFDSTNAQHTHHNHHASPKEEDEAEENKSHGRSRVTNMNARRKSWRNQKHLIGEDRKAGR